MILEFVKGLHEQSKKYSEMFFRPVEKWYDCASVRRLNLKPFGEPDHLIVSSKSFSIKKTNTYFSLSAIHPRVSQLLVSSDSEKVRHFELLQLYRHLRFTSFLEHEIILPTLQDLAFNRLPLSIPRSFSIRALKMATDEAFHGQRSEELIDFLEKKTQIKCPFHESLFRTTSENLFFHSPSFKDLRRFFFSFVSETIISSTILSSLKNVSDPDVVEFFREHFSDEAMHSVYFKELFTTLWPSLSEEQKKAFNFFEDDIRFFISPPWKNALDDMRSAGLVVEAKELEDLLASDMMLKNFLHKKSCVGTVRLLKRFNILKSNSIFRSQPHSFIGEEINV